MLRVIVTTRSVCVQSKWMHESTHPLMIGSTYSWSWHSFKSFTSLVPYPAHKSTSIIFYRKIQDCSNNTLKMWQKTGERKVEITFWTTFVCRLFACCFLGVGPQIWYKQCWCYGNFKYLSSIFVYSIAGSGNSPMYRLNGWIERTSKQGSFWFSLNFRWHGGCESLCVVYLWNMSMVDTRCAAWRDKLQSGKTTHGRNRGGGEANGEKT
jgi:hypothetical protein